MAPFLCGNDNWLYSYYNVFKVYSLSIQSKWKRSLFLFNQRIVLLFNIISALGMNGVAFFDMGNYPTTHMIVGPTLPPHV